MAIIWRGDNKGETQELAAALEAYVERALEGEAAGPGVWELDGGWAVVEEAGDVVTLAFAPDEAEARRLSQGAKVRID